MKFRHYIDFVILACCLVIAFNIHPSNINENNSWEWHTMIYVFHDYEWNEYIMNNKLHWASNSWDYLFNDEVPNDLKWEDGHVDSVSIWEIINNQSSGSIDENTEDSNDVKDNQISMDYIMTDLWLDSSNAEQKVDEDSDTLVISIWDIMENVNEDDYYTIEEKQWDNEDSSLIIQKMDDYLFEIDVETWNSNDVNNDGKSEDNDLQIAKAFTFIEEWRVLPGLVSRNDLYFGDSKEVTAYNDTNLDTSKDKKTWGVTIIDDYEACMTPWWYKIQHWESVLAYKQKADAPDICDIERRFCWKWKLSGTYTQEWCSVNNDYTYEQWWDVKPVKKTSDGFNWKSTRQNSDGSVSVKDNNIGWGYIADRPSYTYTNFISDWKGNVRAEKPAVNQTTRKYRDCTSPWWEKVTHWDFVQAFKHANWFSDAPCEMQIRLCTMWELMWTYTESTCKTWDTSFIDWVNGSPTRDTYSEEKLDLVRKQIKNEEKYYREARKNADRSTDSSNLDRILYILDQD